MNAFLRVGAAACAAFLLTSCGGGGVSAPGVSAQAPTELPLPPAPPPPPVSLHAEPVAGTARAVGHYANGTLATARFYMPPATLQTAQLAFDKAGNLYVADANEVIRKITPAGTVTALAGTPGRVGTADGAGSAASFKQVLGMVADANGNIFVADSASIRKISPEGLVTTLAGKPDAPGFTDGQGQQAAFGITGGGMATDSAGNLYLADTANDAIRRISPAGKVETLALAATLAQPSLVALDAHDNLTVPYGAGLAQFGQSGQLIRTISLAPGGSGLGPVQSIAYGPDGVLYVVNQGATSIAIRTVDTSGNVTTIRSGSTPYGLLDGPVGSARFGSAFLGYNGMAFDATGKLFLTDLANDAVRKLTPALQVTTLTGGNKTSPGFADGTGAAAAFLQIAGFAADNAGNYYVADAGNCAIRKITPARVVTTLAGVGGQCGDADGAGPAARFDNIVAVTQDPQGNLYVAEKTTVRKVTAAGVVTTVAGKPGTTAKADGKGAAASFVNLAGIAMGPDGTLLVSDGKQVTLDGDCVPATTNTLRAITPQGVVSTVPDSEWACTGTPSPLSTSGDLRFDAAGALYLASGEYLATRTAAGAASYLLDNQGNRLSIPESARPGLTLAPDDAGNLFYVMAGAVYKYGPDRVVSLAAAPASAGNPLEVTPDLPVQRISALTYIGNHQFLASFDDQVVILTLN